MKICLVTSFPPSHERVNEYGFHLASELQRDPYVSLTILADEYEPAQDELEGFDVMRCWKPNAMSNPLRLLKTIRQIRPDVVWFNSVFASFGSRAAPAFAGLCTPALLRAAGYSTHVTLHHLMDGIDLKDAGVTHPALYNFGGEVATRLLLLADSATVLLPAYRRTLVQKYRGVNVHLRAHGIFSSAPQYPDFGLRESSGQQILAFGKWGTYKRLETLVAAFERVARDAPNARLVIAGENHPNTPGYVESIAQQVEGNPRISVRGYVAEQDIAELFSTASILVMPYNSATGSSGVAHQACQFGVPIVCADIPEFRDMAEAEHISMDFFRRGDPGSLADCLLALLQDDDRRHLAGEQNFYAAMRMTMPQIIREYLRAFDWHRRSRGTLGRARARVAARFRQPRSGWAHAISRPGILPPAPAVVPIMAGERAVSAGPALVPARVRATPRMVPDQDDERRAA